SLIFSMAMAGVEYVNDAFSTIGDIISLADIIDEYYNDLIGVLDGLMTDTGSDPDSYIPGYETLISLSDLVGKAILYLLDLAKSGKIEKTMILPEDISIYELTYKLYGYDGGDENL